MAEEKPKEHESHEHEVKESKTITLKKSTLWGIGVFALVALLVVSIFTGGFGIMKSSGNAVANNGNTGNSGTASAGDASIFTANPNLYPSLGPSNAKVTVVEMADFQCPYCALASGLPNWTSQYTSQYGDLVGSAGKAEQLAQQGQIQFIFVPLSFLDNPSDTSGPESTQAAQAGFCALQQSNDLFWKMHDAIYQASTGPSEDTGKYSISNLKAIAAGISGMDTSKFNSCLDSNSTLSQVQQVMSQVQQAGFQIATPQFLVNGKSVQASWASIQAAINAA
ncbi:MAG: thioredoxin domain-containing protein [Nanoarchaeota archaeon]|nr:thioredoxin domain-containing protein [Nanoarchaeota archaeon]